MRKQNRGVRGEAILIRYAEDRIVEMRRLISQNGWENLLSQKPLEVWSVFHPESKAATAEKP